ncbi:stabilizer of axonemal microtubules 1 [Scaptodrosophila lebanonensis]|uniref:Stabilizer of axonemal microtubules 1 n=1 Tax=Drosophila lebanonensis TaxID=7225 RepID=A0A6J2THV0_DROLE|nr:stabilizer of axonemal microtubules 1 [Scaptodrosophila lebanonensis]
MSGDCNSYCPGNADPCQAPVDFSPCPPGGDCPPCTGGDYAGCCYQQPPRTQPIRPTSHFMRSTAPLETETIYKRSYYANCGDCYRARPVLPSSQIRSSQAPLEKCTVQKLSYMPPCVCGRTPPIRPMENGLRFEGPIYAMSSQKHDYVPKGGVKRDPIMPRGAICSSSAPMERCTIQKLSYMPVDVCQNPPPKPMVQGSHYCKPVGPMERCTVQKLSYMPVCLPAKEPTPWADKVRCVPPRYQKLCTTYNLSYMPNCNAGRTAPVVPISNLRFLGGNAGAASTVYKMSYMPVDASNSKPAAILPRNTFSRATGPLEKCTIQKLSYQPNCCAERTPPIRPMENGLRFDGPMYAMTTQKHDFVPKPHVRRAPIVQGTAFCRPSGAMERCTVNKLSYMPVDVTCFPRPDPIRPRLGFCRNEGPMENCTTYKLSYMPNCLPPKEPLPWARYTSYCRPSGPIEKCTIQKLSYGPPGSFQRCGGPCGTGNCDPSGFPKAGIC